MRMNRQEKINLDFLKTLAKHLDIINNDCPSTYDLEDNLDVCGEGKCLICWEMALKSVDR